MATRDPRLVTWNEEIQVIYHWATEHIEEDVEALFITANSYSFGIRNNPQQDSRKGFGYLSRKYCRDNGPDQLGPYGQSDGTKTYEVRSAAW